MVRLGEEKPTSIRVKCSISILGHSKRDVWETFPALHWLYTIPEVWQPNRLIFLALRDSEPDAAEQEILFPTHEKQRRRQAEVRVSFVLADGEKKELIGKCKVTETVDDDGRLFWREVVHRSLYSGSASQSMEEFRAAADIAIKEREKFIQLKRLLTNNSRIQ